MRSPGHAVLAAASAAFVAIIALTAQPGARAIGSREPVLQQDPTLPGPLESDEIAFDLVGATGGVARAIAVRGGLAYVGAGTAIDVYDVSDPTAPHPVGAARLLADEPGWIASIAVVGRHAYATVRMVGWGSFRTIPDNVNATSRSGRLWVFDVSDPRAPVQVADIAVDGDTGRLAAVGDRLLVPSVPHLLVFDIARPDEPRLVETINGWSDNDVVVSDGLALGVDGEAHLEVVDLSAAYGPYEVRRLALDGRPEEVAAVGRFAYATIETYPGSMGSRTRLAIVDATDPGLMAEVGSFEMPGPGPGELTCTPHHIWSTGGALAVSTLLGRTGSTGSNSTWERDLHAVLTFLDVTETIAPRVTATYRFEPGIDASDIVVRDGHVLLTATDLNFGGWHAGDADVAVVGGVRVLDARTSGALNETGRWVPLARAARVVVGGNLLYVSESVDGGGIAAPDRLHIASMTDGGVVVQRGTLTVTQLGGMVLAPELGPRLLVATGGDATRSGAILLIDASDPDHPKQAAAIDVTGTVSGLSWSAPYALALIADADETVALAVIDFVEPERPRQIASLSLEGGRNLASDARLAYVSSCSADGLCIVNLADPTRPRLVPDDGDSLSDFFDLAAESRRFLFGTRARSESDESFTTVLTVIDMAEPSRWRVVGETDIANGGISGLTVEGGILAASAWWTSHVWVYDVSDPARPRRLGTQVTADSDPADVAITGCRLAVADAFGGLQIYAVRPTHIPPPWPRPRVEVPVGWHAAYLPRTDSGVTCPLAR